MKTAVQLRTGAALGAQLVHGSPHELRDGRLGPIALFESGRLVAYQLRRSRRPSLFVFRTLEADDRLAAAVPGVHPHVHLLLEVHASGRVRLARSLFAYVHRQPPDAASLSDDFFARASVALAGRLPAQHALTSLLASLPSTSEAKGSPHGCLLRHPHLQPAPR